MLEGLHPLLMGSARSRAVAIGDPTLAGAIRTGCSTTLRTWHSPATACENAAPAKNLDPSPSGMNQLQPSASSSRGLECVPIFPGLRIPLLGNPHMAEAIARSNPMAVKDLTEPDEIAEMIALFSMSKDTTYWNR